MERGRVEATASLGDWLARAAAERNSGEIRTVAARIRRMIYLLGVDSNHHDHRTSTTQLSNHFSNYLLFNNLNGHVDAKFIFSSKINLENRAPAIRPRRLHELAG